VRYNFRVYIITNANEGVLYIDVTNGLARRSVNIVLKKFPDSAPTIDRLH
jgi:predicted GIY-YIG superfamily endonuclease